MSTRPLDIALIHDFLRSSYWAKAIPREIVTRAVENSLCFGLFHNGKQIGFGRVVTDRATFAYLADVFVIDSYRGLGLGKWLISCVLDHPELQGLRSLAACYAGRAWLVPAIRLRSIAQSGKVHGRLMIRTSICARHNRRSNAELQTTRFR